ncbi:hypothetical protein MNBD_GAMMA21-3, partial [hydrothermal vent metagenome]
EIWNLGHLFGFLILWLFMINLFPVFYPDSIRRVGLVFLIMLAASAAIEIIQHYIGRSASVKDVGLNIAGTMIAMSIVILRYRTFRKMSYGVVVIFILVVFVLIWPTVKIFIDEINISRQFPVLSDFTTPFESGRWQSSDADMVLVKEKDLTVLDVVLLPENKYSSVALNSFGQGWEKYRELVIELNNTMELDIPLVLRLHDKHHKKYNNQHSDRFNRSINLAPGYREIIIPIIDLYNSPRDRKMDVNNIESIMIFAININKKKHFRIYKVFLR